MLPSAAAVRIAEALRPVVPAAGRGGIHERQALGAVRRRAFLVQIDLHVRHAGLPAQLQQQRRVVERPRRGVDHMALDAAVLAGLERLHAEFDEAVLAEQALPAFARAPSPDRCGRSNRSATIGIKCRIVGRCNRRPRNSAAPGTRRSRGQVSRGRFVRVRETASDRPSRRNCAVGHRSEPSTGPPAS